VAVYFADDGYRQLSERRVDFVNQGDERSRGFGRVLPKHIQVGARRERPITGTGDYGHPQAVVFAKTPNTFPQCFELRPIKRIQFGFTVHRDIGRATGLNLGKL
jgi:hypothetical protein